MSLIGRRARPIDWEARTSGALRYTADLSPAGMLHACVVRSRHPYARLLAVDTRAAAAMPGVRAIATIADFPPGARYLHEGAADRPPMAEGVVRFVGQEIAAVAADSPAQARAACAAIRVDYAPLPAPLHLDDAIDPRAARLHDRPTSLPNRAVAVHRRWGKLRAGAAITRRAAGRFLFPAQHHACLEPGVVVAAWSEAAQTLELWSPTGAPYYVAIEVAHVLGLDAGQVLCREVGIGGSFGSRTKVCDYETIAACLSRKAGAPVRLLLGREDDFATTKSRHAFRIDLSCDGDEEGRLRTIRGHVETDNGAYSHSGGSVMGAGLKGLGMLYVPDSLDVTAELIDTAKRPGGQFRGYGTTQTAFALECLVDELAEASAVDPIDYRIANANPPSSTTLVGARIGSSGLAECLAACRQAIGWAQAKASARFGIGVGVASAVHVSGSHVGGMANRSDCAVDLHRDGRIRVRFGGGDAGTGQKTILAQIVATELGVPLEQVAVTAMDSEHTPFDMGAWSSRGTHYSGHAARQAATAMREQLGMAAARRLGNAPLRFEDGHVRSEAGFVPIGALVADCAGAGAEVYSVEASFVEEGVAPADRATGLGNVSASYNFAAHAARVAVSPRTGALRLLDYVAAHDVGTAINPMMVDGQIVGGAAMGIGIALGEEVITEQGRVVNGAFVNYAMPRAGDLPEIRPIIVPGSDPAGPYGAKAVGETGVNPAPAAIANAIYDAVGVRLREPPFTPDKILDALAAVRGARRGFAIWRRPGRWWIALVRRVYPLGLFRLLHARALARRDEPVAAPLRGTARPHTIEALAAARAAGAVPLGGGIDLHLRRRQGLETAAEVAAVAGVAEMRMVEPLAPGGWRLGAGATLADLALWAAERVPALAQAIETIASPQVRAVATLGGNLLQANRCWFFRNGFDCWKRRGGLAPCYAIQGDHRFYHAAVGGHRCQAVTPSDLATVLIALDATAVAVSADGTTRSIPITTLYRGPGETVLQAGEILVAVEIGSAALERQAAFEKLRLWEGDFALASVLVGARIDAAGRWSDVRIVLGGIAPTPLRLGQAEHRLAGEVASGEQVRAAVAAALAGIAHPLPRNGWKIDAAAGLAADAGDRLVGATLA